MSHEVNPAKLSFMIFPTRFPQPSYQSEYRKAYLCWRSVWNEAFKEEMNIKEDLYSDNYTRQSHVAAVFYEGEVAGLMTLNYMDLNDPVAMDDSYFKVWPELAKMRLKKEARSAIITGNFTINFNFRKKAHGLCWKSLVCAFLVRHLKLSPFDAAVATPRLERSVEKICYGTGAHPLQQNLPYTIEGQRIDLISWHRDLDEKKIDPEIWSLVNYVWENSSTIIETLPSYSQQGDKRAA